MEIINYLKRNNGSGHIVEHIGWHESGDYMLRLLFSDDDGFRQHKYEVEKEYNVINKSEIESLERQRCGRRDDFGRSATQSEVDNVDTWRKSGKHIKCSYCGSLHPMDVIEIIKEHGFQSRSGSDKDYKWYIKNGDGGIKYYRQHDTKEFIDAYNALVDSRKQQEAK